MVLSAKSSPTQKYLLVSSPSCVPTSLVQLTVYLFFFFKMTKLKVNALLYLSKYSIFHEPQFFRLKYLLSQAIFYLFYSNVDWNWFHFIDCLFFFLAS